MRPYLLEGLDCSGKKAVAKVVATRLLASGCLTRIVIGPLIGGVIGTIDSRLANLVRYPRKGSLTDVTRRLLYISEPVLDGLIYRPPANQVVLKVSSHYRAWARALLENDAAMVFGFESARTLHVRYSGAALLTADFETRIGRHRRDIANGAHKKVEATRFLGPDKIAFDLWQEILEGVLRKNVRNVLRLKTDGIDLESLADIVTKHILEVI